METFLETPDVKTHEISELTETLEKTEFSQVFDDFFTSGSSPILSMSDMMTFKLLKTMYLTESV